MPELKLLLLQVTVILIAARLAGAAFRLAGQPAVVGEMTAGILLGPSVLGRIAPGTLNALFPAASLGPLYAASQVGLILFLFLMGLEIQPASLRGSGRGVAAASLAGIAAPFAGGVALAVIFYGRIGGGAPRLGFALFLGTAMAVTAFPVLARILAERRTVDRGRVDRRVAAFAMSCAAINDVVAWCLLAAVTVIARPEANQSSLAVRFGLLAIYVTAMLLAVRPLLRRVLPADAEPAPERFAGAMIFLVASAWVTEALSVHAMFGAFMAGVVIPKGAKLEAAFRERLEAVTLALFVPLFFAYSGLRTSVALLSGASEWELCGLIVVTAVSSKFLATALSVRMTGMAWRESLTAGVLMNTRGLVELVILNAGLDLHILPPELFSMMVLMALATTAMTAPLLDRISARSPA